MKITPTKVNRNNTLRSIERQAVEKLSDVIRTAADATVGFESFFSALADNFTVELLHSILKKGFGIKKTGDLPQDKFNQFIDYASNELIEWGVDMDDFWSAKIVDQSPKHLIDKVYKLWESACRKQDIRSQHDKNELLGVYVFGFTRLKGWDTMKSINEYSPEELAEFVDYMLDQAVEFDWLDELPQPWWKMAESMDRLLITNHKHKVCPITGLTAGSMHHLTPIGSTGDRKNDDDMITVYLHDSMHVAGWDNDSAHGGGTNEFMSKFRFNECTLTKGAIKGILNGKS